MCEVLCVMCEFKSSFELSDAEWIYGGWMFFTKFCVMCEFRSSFKLGDGIGQIYDVVRKGGVLSNFFSLFLLRNV